jgi:hypothetical protein
MAQHTAGPATCPEWTGKEGNSNLTGKTEAACYQPGVSTKVILVLGQSNAINIVADLSFVPTAGTENFNFYNGKNYQAKDPLFGCENAGGNVLLTPGSSFATRLGSKMVVAGMASRVVIVNMAIGATSLAEWIPGGLLGDRPRFVIRAMQQAGFRPDYVLQFQGESDVLAGTSAAMYAARQQTLVAEFRRNGCSAPYFVSQTSLINGGTAPNMAAVRQGQLDACSVPLGILQGPDTDTLSVAGGYRIADNTHLNVAGIDAAATLWKNVLMAF